MCRALPRIGIGIGIECRLCYRVLLFFVMRGSRQDTVIDVSQSRDTEKI